MLETPQAAPSAEAAGPPPAAQEDEDDAEGYDGSSSWVTEGPSTSS